MFFSPPMCLRSVCVFERQKKKEKKKSKKKRFLCVFHLIGVFLFQHLFMEQ